ncbi:hypothetical protein BN938_2409 [Mucinivorans hirudinis]|uniref:Uncharacterized protein n=1 Tax=Mucinivorans hirudinis TaxID=1433126 RepID=A0A060RE83_9BACT|nr:hypothetical protein BN938_2409 [Mucinivorans hirudinis]
MMSFWDGLFRPKTAENYTHKIDSQNKPDCLLVGKGRYIIPIFLILYEVRHKELRFRKCRANYSAVNEKHIQISLDYNFSMKFL